MKETILLLAEIVDVLHDVLLNLSRSLGLDLTDKELHFWIVGFVGIVSFLVVDVLFRVLSKWSMSVLSFIYTFTVVLVFVFALEIQQGITGSGNMEFDDAVMGIFGFFAFVAVYAFMRGIGFGYKKLMQKRNQSVDT